MSLSLACSSLGLGYLLVLELLLLSSLVVVRGSSTANSSSSAYAACQASAESTSWRVTSTASAASRSCWGIQENTSPSKRLSLTAFSKYVFQGQEIREYRKSGTCEVASSRMCRVRETWFGEETES
jgi:hypothetical protein